MSHEGGCQHNTLTQAFPIYLRACLHIANHSRETNFTKEHKTILCGKYKEVSHIIESERDTAAADKSVVSLSITGKVEYESAYILSTLFSNLEKIYYINKA